jgi:hypothetical protein
MAYRINRRQVLSIGVAASVAGISPSFARMANGKTALEEHTFLKAAPGKRENLIRYLKANWLEMDRKGVEAKIFTYYQLLEDIDENKAWDLVMVVGYPNTIGYEEPNTKAAFNDIRSKHKEVLIDGEGLKTLGQIVEHHRLRITV